MCRYPLFTLLLLFLTGCEAQSSDTNWTQTSSGDGPGKLYRHREVPQAQLLAFTFAELASASGTTYPGPGTPIDQLERAYEIMRFDALTDREHTAGTATVQTGEVYREGADDYELFTARLDPGVDGGTVYLLLAPPDAYEAVGGEEALDRSPFANAPATTSRQPEGFSPSVPLAADYPPPVREVTGAGYTFAGWEVDESDRIVARANDPASPRLVQVKLPSRSARTYEAAVDQALQQIGVRNAQYLPLRELEASAQLVGGKEYITIGRSILDGHPATLFVAVYDNAATEGNKVVKVFETPSEVYRKWGGIAAMMMGQDIIADPEVFPAETREQIAQAGPQQQLDLYHAAHSKVMYDLAKGIMMTQSATTMRMMELNYDLLLGGDITDPFIGN